MNRLLGTLAVTIALVAATGQMPVSGQAPGGSNGEGASSYQGPRTPWGDPDLQGHWLPGGGGMMETPAGEPWKGESSDANAAFSGFFDPNRGASRPARARAPQRPMIVDPADGKVPLQPWAMAKRTEIMEKQEQVQYLDPRVRCLQSGIPRANLPVGYNTYQFLQIPGYVILLYEWNHMFRYIPLDGRPHVSPNIRMPMGDSRGRWEGNTLVVDVTNFTDRTWVVGHGAPPEGAPASSIMTGHGVFHTEALHVVERFTLVDANTIRYEATIEDPNVFTRPWTIRFNAFNRAPADHQLYEYACHEGNIRNIRLMTGFDVETGKMATPAKKD
jgi:hypothetical protein